jgi:nucleotide-binding universal stress UspA family protein
MIRSILVPLVGPLLGPEPLDVGFALAQRFEAYLDAFHPALDPAASAAYLGEGTTGALIETVVEAAEEESSRRMQAARALFDERLGRAGDVGGRAQFLTDRRRDTDLVAVRARVSDLTILPLSGVRNDPSTAAVWEALLYESGRPALLAPDSGGGERLRRPGTVLIAWTESPEAARAVAYAAPFWSQATRLVAVPISGDKLDALGTYVGRHGGKMEAEVLPRIERGALEDSRGEAILQIVDRIGADMIVMGAYTHGRLRRFIMGGVTKTIVENTTIPVLMAH